MVGLLGLIRPFAPRGLLMVLASLDVVGLDGSTVEGVREGGGGLVVADALAGGEEQKEKQEEIAEHAESCQRMGR